MFFSDKITFEWRHRCTKKTLMKEILHTSLLSTQSKCVVNSLGVLSVTEES